MYTVWATDVEHQPRNANNVGIWLKVEREFVSVMRLMNFVIHWRTGNASLHITNTPSLI